MRKPNLTVVDSTKAKVDDGKTGNVILLPTENEYWNVHVDAISPNPCQPRKIFNQVELEMLAETIKANGKIEEDVRLIKKCDRNFIIINGERRWRATKMAGLTHVPAKICDISEDELLEQACLANFCVAEMSLVEQAFAFKALMNKKGWSQSELARRIGRSQGMISNALKIFNLSEEIQSAALYGKIAPVVALRLASYEIHDQSVLLNACKEEIQKNGKPFAPNELLLFFKKKALDFGIDMKKSKKQSRRHVPYQELLARSAMRAIDQLLKKLEALREIKLDELKEMKDPTLAMLLAKMEDAEDAIFESSNFFEPKPESE